MTRILIADDHELVREGASKIVGRQPGWEVCGTASTGREAIEQARILRPDVVVLDMNMPEIDGLEAARQIKRDVPQSEVLMLTGFDSQDLIAKFFEVGASGFVLKSEGADRLIEAIQSLADHQPCNTSKVSALAVGKPPIDSRQKAPPSTHAIEELSGREREVIQLLTEGKSNKQVAAALGISIRTVESHRAVILRKLHLDSFAALVRYAIRNKIVGA